MRDINLGLDDFHHAWKRIKNRVHRTPLESATLIGQEIGVELYLKCENLQKTGSFKVRGNLNKILQLDADSKARGVVTISAGNHAQALAWASRMAQTPCTVVMPETAQKSKVDASKGYGAEVILHGTVFEAFEKSFELARENKLTFIHPFEDLDIIAGHGSLGLEILDQLGNVDIIVVGIGGGGLISGISAAVKLTKPDVRIFGVEPVGADSMRRSLDTGKAVKLNKVETIADGLGSPMAGETTFEFVKKYVDDVVIVSDDEITRAMNLLLSRCKLLTEPAGAASVAALLHGKILCSDGDRVAAVLSGGNIDIDRLKELV